MITTWTTLLITGLRGNGKTLKAVGLMADFVAAGVPVFACNFNGLKLPGVQFLDDAREWQSLPPGSVLFVDEAQRFWRSRRSGDPPPEVIAMETQRHDAVRMVLLTQQPTFLDKHVRGLVDSHQHLIRRAGLPASQVYEWERCKEEPESPANVELAEKSIYAFQSQYFGTYESAQQHTIKRKIPARAKFIAAAAVVVAGLLWWATDSLKPSGATEPTPEGVASAGVPAAGGTTVAPLSGDPEGQTERLWASMKPRIPGALWSAPLYDEHNEVQDAPEVYCMIGSECRCITSEGIRYDPGQAACRVIVNNGGISNPYRRRQREERREGAAPLAQGGGTAPTETASPGATISADQVSGYGGIAAGRSGSAP